MSKYDPKITHKDYDTFRTEEHISVNQSLDDLVKSAIESVKEFFIYEVENKNLNKEDNLTLDCLRDSIDYNGDLHNIIDSEVPIYTHEIRSLFFINEWALVEALEYSCFEILKPTDENYKQICIFSYIDMAVNNWVSEELENWFNSKFWELE
tara:strand:+ start:729 stop:1184 length:456 start_codon:yes stop_codon:yes gene_type:complete